MLSEFILNIQKVWWSLFIVCHVIGKVLVVCLFIFSSSTIINLVLASYGYPIFFSFVVPFGSVYDDKLPWAATSMLLASTVAIGHMRNLEINEEKLRAEIEERIKAEKIAVEKEKPKTFFAG